jgi:hypothetical protein
MFIRKQPAALLAAATCAVALVGYPASAATKAEAHHSKDPVTVIARGLQGPRQLSASGGRFYVAESDAGQVSAVNPRTGAKKVVVKGLVSVQGVVRVGGKLYIASGEPDPDNNPTGATGAAIFVAKPGHKARKFADLLKYELRHNPDKQTQFGPDGKPLDALSNPYYVIRDRHGFLLVADAGGNDVLKVNRHGKPSTFFLPPVIKTGACANVPNNNASGKGCDPVPTGLAYGPHNTLYVSALTSLVPGEGRVYVINARTGKLLRTIKGFSAPTGVAVGKHGTVYVSELLQGAPPENQPPPPGFDPSTVGQIVKVNPGHARTYAQVTMPSGLLIKGGKLYASAWSVGTFVGKQNAGQIVRVADCAFVRP